ncbi:endolytic transglycosylase MltG [Azonexus sp.]|uniref:endolytic transglycosylase MltG n=1 Tax=Azonexus sp. TaxID=1872668 RepID=UPI0039E6F84E
MRFTLRLLLVLFLLVALASGLFYAWATQTLLPSSSGAPAATRPAIEFRIPPGSGLRAIVQIVNAAGVPLNASLFAVLARVQGQGGALKAGSYVLAADETAQTLLQKLVGGKVSLVSVVLVEGWTFRQFRARLDAQTTLQHDSQGLSEADIAQKLGLTSLEGRFLPDTYLFDTGSSDFDILRRAQHAMDRALASAWQARAAGLPYKNAEEALIMASIIEKETGRAEDRTQVAAVFVNRLRIGMRLQTDPSVIYGLGENFDGNLRKIHLQTDTPYNTYTRAGLPPTPIAMPGLAALQAAFAPAQTPALYFVARGDGSSHFSRTLEEHNRAVNRYQRGRP